MVSEGGKGRGEGKGLGEGTGRGEEKRRRGEFRLTKLREEKGLTLVGNRHEDKRMVTKGG